MVAFGEYSDDDTASAMKAGDYKDATDLAVYGLTTEQTPKYSKERALTLTKQSPSGGGQPQCVAYPLNTQIVTRGGAMGRGTGFGMGALNDPSYTLQAGHSHAVAHVDVMPTMVSGGSTTASHGQMSGQFREGYITPTAGMQVRRLTPTECERLQGFPDGYTAIPWRGKPANDCPDGPRYKALGNSMAVPVMRWIGARILTQLLTNQRGADHGTR